MTIALKPEQERMIQQAIDKGSITSVDDFIDTAIAVLLGFGNNAAPSARQDAVRRMWEFGDQHQLSLGEPITRKLLHEGHRY